MLSRSPWLVRGENLSSGPLPTVRFVHKLLIITSNNHDPCSAGDIIGLSILGRKVVVLNAFDDANDLLSFRGANYSDRPKMTLSAD